MKNILLTISFIITLCWQQAVAQWTSLSGPPGGNIEKIQVDSNNKAYALVGSQNLYTSTNDGTSWTKVIVNEPSNIYFYDILVDGTDLYGTDYNYLYKSTDGGLNWVIQNTNSNFQYGDNLIKVTGNTFAVYSQQGLYISSNAGVTWVKINDTEVNHAVVNNSGDLFFIDNEGVNRHLASAQPWAASNVTLVNPYTTYKYWDRLAVQGGTKLFLSKENDLMRSNTGASGTWITTKTVTITDTYFEGNWSLATNGDLYFFNNSSRNTYKTTLAGGGVAWTVTSNTSWPTNSYANTTVRSVVHTSATKVFVGSYGDGVFLSTDAAVTWSLRSSGINQANGLNIEVATSGRILYQTGNSSKGYWFSDNGGTTWSFSAQLFNVYGMYKMPNGTLLLRTSSGTAYSTNNGTSWTIIATSLTDIVSTSSNVLFGVTSVLSTSINNGATWTTVTGITGLPTSFYINDVETDDTRLYFYVQNYSNSTYEVYKYDIATKVATKLNNPDRSSETSNYYRKMLANNGKLYVAYSQNIDISADQGATWTSSSFQSSSISAIPGAICVGNQGSLYTTQDDGKTWTSTSLPSGSEYAYINDIAIDAAGDFYAAVTGSPALKLTTELIVPPASLPPYIDFNWQPTNGPYGAYINKVLTDNTSNVYSFVNYKIFKAANSANSNWTKKTPTLNGYELYINDFTIDKATGKLFAVEYSRLVTSIDGGNSWVQDPANEFNIQARSRIKRCTNGDVIFTTYDTNPKVYVSVNGGITFGAPKKSFTDRSVEQLEVTPSNGIYVWVRLNADGKKELHKSLDRGVTWSQVLLPTLAPTDNFQSFSTDISGKVYLKSGNDIFLSADAGATWASIKFNLSNGIDNSRIFQPTLNGPIYTTFNYGPYNSNYAIYKLPDGGNTWTKVTNADLDVYIYDIAWLGTRMLIATDLGLLVSDDDGTTLLSKNTGLTGLEFNEIELVSPSKLMLEGYGGSFQSSNFQDWTKDETNAFQRYFTKIDGALLGQNGNGLFQTSDGNAWTQVSTLPSGPNDLSNNGVSYTTITQNNKVYISNDLTTWTEITVTGLPSSILLRSVASDLSGNTIVCLYNYTNSEDEVYRIKFGSATKLNVAQQPFFVRFFKGKLMLYDKRGSLYTSTNSTIWTQKGAPAGEKFIIAAKNLFFITAYSGGLWLSRDEGITWQSVGLATNDYNLRFLDVTVNEFTGYIYASVAGREILKSGNVILPDDGQAPLVASLSPANNATGVSIRPELKITFDEPVIPQTSKKLFILDVTQPNVPIETINVTAGIQNGKTFSFTPTTLLGYNKSYFIAIDEKEPNPSPPPAEISAFHDIFGRPFEGFSATNVWSFTTKGAPTLTTLDPIDGSTGVVVSSPLKITFNEPMNLASGKTLKLYKSSAPTVAITTLGSCIPQNQFVSASSSPIFRNQPLTINFDASKGGTQLIGASKVYAHAFLFTHSEGEIISTVYTVGNFGQDDGIGQMAAVAGQANKWVITLGSSLDQYFSVPPNKTIDSLGIIFRNAGSLKATPPSTIAGASVASNGDVFFEVNNGNTLTFPLCSSLEFGTAYFVQSDVNSFLSFEGQAQNFVNTATAWNFITEDAPDSEKPVISFTTVDFVKGSTNKLQVTITDNKSAAADIVGFIRYQGITKNTNFKDSAALVLNATSQKFEAAVQDTWIDELGLEFSFRATDKASNSATSTIYRSYIKTETSATAPQLPALTSGGTLVGYKIVAVPHKLTNSSVASVFDELGPVADAGVNYQVLTYDKTNANSWDAYPADFTTITRGKGYWINSKSGAQVIIENATTPNDLKTNQFKFNLQAGWNQIGNPYPFPILWSVVKGNNPNIGSLYKFNGTGYTNNSQQLAPMEGGFVFVSGTLAITLEVPFAANANGRTNNTQQDFTNGWHLPIKLSQNDVFIDYVGIGMHPQASEDQDQYDNLNPPKFIRYLEATFTKTGLANTVSVARDIVPNQQEYQWSFTLDSNIEGPAEMQWDNLNISTSDKTLYLLDVASQQLVNMKDRNRYSFNPKESSSFKIYYGIEVLPEQIGLNPAFPNPTEGKVVIGFSLPKEGGNTQKVEIEMLDVLGRSIGAIAAGNYPPGYHELEWDGSKVMSGQGLYTYRLSVANNQGKKMLQGKIMVKK